MIEQSLHIFFTLIFSSRSVQMAPCPCFSKKVRQPRKKRIGPYQKVNAYTQQLSFQQVLTLLIFILQLAGHSVFIVPTLPGISNSILWTMLGFHYALLLVIGADYLYLTTKDPVDKLIISESQIVKYKLSQLKFCLVCDNQVHKNSHHCMSCNRCVQEFDHHCKFLNNCIGSRNYEAFFRLLMVYSFYNLNLVGMAAWTCIENFANLDLGFHGNQWGIIVEAAFTLLVATAVASLLFFHCYITCCENTTTYGRAYDPRSFSPSKNKIIAQSSAPVSAQRLGREEVQIHF